MISTLKPLKSEEIMETPRRVWKQLLYVKVVGPFASREAPTPKHPAPASRSGLCRGLHPLTLLTVVPVVWK